MANCNSFSGRNSVLILNGRRILGTTDAEDSIKITYNDAPANIVEGMSGASQVNLSGSNTVSITLKVFATHPDHKFLSDIDSAMRQGICTPLDVSFTDIATGEGGTSDSGALISTADTTTGKGASGEREWTIGAANWVKNNLGYQ